MNNVNIILLLKNFLKRKGKNKLAQPINVLDGILYINNKKVPFLDNEVKKYSNGKNACEYIIMHYTASTTIKSAHNTYLDPKTKVSWHIDISRDGLVTQLLSFDKIAWHAGKSKWNEGAKLIRRMNPVSVGIEMSNAGQLTEKNGSYVTWYGQRIPNIDVFFDKNGNPWQKFSPQQLAAAKYLTVELAKELKVKDILTHSMVSNRKQDTGPAFEETYRDIRKTYFKNS